MTQKMPRTYLKFVRSLLNRSPSVLIANQASQVELDALLIPSQSRSPDTEMDPQDFGMQTLSKYVLAFHSTQHGPDIVVIQEPHEGILLEQPSPPETSRTAALPSPTTNRDHLPRPAPRRSYDFRRVRSSSKKYCLSSR
jgi:hypothetical protein